MKRLIFSSCILFLCGLSQAQPLRFFEFGFRTLPDSLYVIAATSDTAVIRKALAQLALPEASRSLFINGTVQYGTLTNNPIYTWHFVSNDWDLVENAIEVCDGNPMDVEHDRKYWIETVGRFCPWSSLVKREIIPSGVIPGASKYLRIHPNPASTILTIDIGPENLYAISLLNAVGKIVYHSTAATPIDLRPYSEGLYYVLVQYSKGAEVWKILKEKD